MIAPIDILGSMAGEYTVLNADSSWTMAKTRETGDFTRGGRQDEVWALEMSRG
jgi:hypothetical protein